MWQLIVTWMTDVWGLSQFTWNSQGIDLQTTFLSYLVCKWLEVKLLKRWYQIHSNLRGGGSRSPAHFASLFVVTDFLRQTSLWMPRHHQQLPPHRPSTSLPASTLNSDLEVRLHSNGNSALSQFPKRPCFPLLTYKIPIRPVNKSKSRNITNLRRKSPVLNMFVLLKNKAHKQKPLFLVCPGLWCLIFRPSLSKGWDFNKG